MKKEVRRWPKGFFERCFCKCSDKNVERATKEG